MTRKPTKDIVHLETLYVIALADRLRNTDTFKYSDGKELSTRDLICYLVMKMQDRAKPLYVKTATDRIRRLVEGNPRKDIPSKLIALNTDIKYPGYNRDVYIYSMTEEGSKYLAVNLQKLVSFYGEDKLKSFEQFPEEDRKKYFTEFVRIIS